MPDSHDGIPLPRPIGRIRSIHSVVAWRSPVVPCARALLLWAGFRTRPERVRVRACPWMRRAPTGQLRPRVVTSPTSRPRPAPQAQRRERCRHRRAGGGRFGTGRGGRRRPASSSGHGRTSALGLGPCRAFPGRTPHEALSPFPPLAQVFLPHRGRGKTSPGWRALQGGGGAAAGLELASAAHCERRRRPHGVLSRSQRASAGIFVAAGASVRTARLWVSPGMTEHGCEPAASPPA